jgi:hypothetical protein
MSAVFSVSVAVASKLFAASGANMGTPSAAVYKYVVLFPPSAAASVGAEFTALVNFFARKNRAAMQTNAARRFFGGRHAVTGAISRNVGFYRVFGYSCAGGYFPITQATPPKRGNIQLLLFCHNKLPRERAGAVEDNEKA